MSTQKARMYDRIREHGENVKAIFGLSADPIKLAKSLRRLESKASRITTDYANGTVDSDKAQAELKVIENKMDKLLKNKNKKVPTFINQDPRGYVLKINDDFARNVKIHRDFGGYGILAPDLTETN